MLTRKAHFHFSNKLCIFHIWRWRRENWWEQAGRRVNSVIRENNKKQEKQQQIISEYLTFDPPPHLEDRETSGNKFIKEAKHGSVFQFVPAGKNATDLEKHSQILSNEIPSMEFSDLEHFSAVIQPRNKEWLSEFYDSFLSLLCRYRLRKCSI